MGGQLRVYTDGYADPHVPGCGLRFGSCREPGTGHRGGQLQHGANKVRLGSAPVLCLMCVFGCSVDPKALIFFQPQDVCSTAGVFDPVLAALEVHSLPAEALEGV